MQHRDLVKHRTVLFNMNTFRRLMIQHRWQSPSLLLIYYQQIGFNKQNRKCWIYRKRWEANEIC